MTKSKKLIYKGKEVELLTEIIEMDEDVTKLGHSLICKSTKQKLHEIDWSPYSDMSIEDVELYLNLDCPKRLNYAPLDRSDLEFIAKTRNLVANISQKTNKNTLEI